MTSESVKKGIDKAEKIAAILAKLDITLSELRDALRGTGAKDFTTLEADVESINAKVATEETLSAIKSQTDKLQFDASNFLRAALAADEVGIAKDTSISSLKFVDKTYSQKISCAAGAATHVYIKPPEGEIWLYKSLSIELYTGSTSSYVDVFIEFGPSPYGDVRIAHAGNANNLEIDLAEERFLRNDYYLWIYVFNDDTVDRDMYITVPMVKIPLQ